MRMDRRLRPHFHRNHAVSRKESLPRRWPKIPMQRRPANNRLHRPAAPCSRRPMEHGRGFPVRKSIPPDKPRASPRREVRTSKRAEKPVASKKSRLDDHGDDKRRRELRRRATDHADCAGLSILFRISSQTDLTSAVITDACSMRSKISFASSRYFCEVSWT